MLNIREAAERMGVSQALVYALCSSRRLRHSRVGIGRGTIRISEEAIAEYLKAGECGPAPVAQPKRKVKLHHLDLP